MFNLETAVEEWCQGVGNPQGESAELKEELKLIVKRSLELGVESLPFHLIIAESSILDF